MVYGAPIEQLLERHKNFAELCHGLSRVESPYAEVVASDALYHSMCVIVQRLGISKDHPKVIKAQQMYIDGLLLEAESTEVIQAKLDEDPRFPPHEHTELRAVVRELSNARFTLQEVLPANQGFSLYL